MADIATTEARDTVPTDADRAQGKLTIEISGMETAVDLSQTVKTTVKTTDTNPAQSKSPAP